MIVIVERYDRLLAWFDFMRARARFHHVELEDLTAEEIADFLCPT